MANYEDLEYAIAYLRKDMMDMMDVMASLRNEIARLADAVETITKNSSEQQNND